MKSLLSLLALVVALGAPAEAIIVPNIGGRVSNAPIKVAPGQQRDNGAVKVTNGNWNGVLPAYSDSTNSATITPGGQNPVNTPTTVRLGNGFEGNIEGTGGSNTNTTVEYGPNCDGICRLWGGDVTVGNGCVVFIINDAPLGGPNLYYRGTSGPTWALPPQSGTQLPPQ